MPTIADGEVTLLGVVLSFTILLAKAIGEFAKRRWPLAEKADRDTGRRFATLHAKLDVLGKNVDELLGLERDEGKERAVDEERHKEHFATTKRIEQELEALRRHI